MDTVEQLLAVGYRRKLSASLRSAIFYKPPPEYVWEHPSRGDLYFTADEAYAAMIEERVKLQQRKMENREQRRFLQWCGL